MSLPSGHFPFELSQYSFVLLFLSLLVAVAGCGGGGGGGGGAALNSNPVASAAAVDTPEDTPLTVNLLDFVVDPDGDSLVLDLVQGPQNGTLTGPEINGDVTYTPGPDFHGNDSFTYKASDGHGGEVQGLVAIEVLPVNDAPVAQDDSTSTLKDSAVEIFVLSNDSDVEQDTLTVRTVTQPLNGVVQIGATGDSIIYTPLAGFFGADPFDYTVNDGNGGNDQATVTVEVLSIGFTFAGADQSFQYDPETGVAALTVPVTVQENPTSGGIRNTIDAFHMDLQHNPELLSVADVRPGQALENLNGGAGPILFDVQILADGFTVQVETGDLLEAVLAQELILVDYQAKKTDLAGDPHGFSTELQWGASNSLTVPLGKILPDLTPIAFELLPVPPAPGTFSYFAPGQTVLYELNTGEVSFDELVYLQEGPGGVGFPNPIAGFSMGLRHDTTYLNAQGVIPGVALEALNGNTGPDFFVTHVQNEGFNTGITAAILVSFSLQDALHTDGPQEVLVVTYISKPGMLVGNPLGGLAGLMWTEGLGTPPTQNVIAIGEEDVIPNPMSGSICLQPSSP
ncbi:MAG: cadherin-like domain-containing protein [Planctomycetota bacterium]